MPIYTSELKKTGDAVVHNSGTGSTINANFVLGGGEHNGMRSRSNIAFVLGATGENVPTGTDAYVISLTHGTLKINGGNVISSGKVVTIEFWSVGPGNSYNAGKGFTTGADNEAEQGENDDLILQSAASSDSGFSSPSTVEVYWQKSTTNLDPSLFSSLGTLGKIRPDDFSKYTGGGGASNATNNLVLHAYKVTFKLDANKFIRLKKDGHAGGLADHVFLYDIKVIIEDDDDENTDKISSRESLTLQIDKDDSSIGAAEKFSFTAGDAGTEVANIDESGNLQMDGDLTVSGDQITFGNGATIVNTDADTLTVTEANIAVAGNFSVSGDTTTFTSANANDPLVIIKNTTNDANSARLQFVKVKGAAGADDDVAGLIEFYADNSQQMQIKWAEIKAEVKEAARFTAGGKFTISVAEHDGTSTAGLVIEDGDANGELDVTIGAGAASLTTVAGRLAISGDITGDTNTFTSANANDPLIIIENTANDATSARLKFNKNRGVDGVDSDDIGDIQFWSYDDGTPSVQQYAGILAEISDATSGQEGGKLSLRVASHNGTVTSGLVIEDGNANGELDVTIGAGGYSLTTVAGKLSAGGTYSSNPIQFFELDSSLADVKFCVATAQKMKGIHLGNGGKQTDCFIGGPLYVGGGYDLTELFSGGSGDGYYNASGTLTIWARFWSTPIDASGGGHTLTPPGSNITLDYSTDGNAYGNARGMPAARWGIDSNNPITVADHSDFTFTDTLGLTISFWLYIPDEAWKTANDGHVIASKGGADNELEWFIYWTNAGSGTNPALWFIRKDVSAGAFKGSRYQDLDGANDFAPGWHHIVIVDGTTAGGNDVTFYRNGTAVVDNSANIVDWTFEPSDAYTATENLSGDLYIGGGYSPYADGGIGDGARLAEFAIWRSVLDADDITAVWSASRFGYGSNTTSHLAVTYAGVFSKKSYEITTSNAANMEIASTGLIRRATSDRRGKKEIEELKCSLEEVCNLIPRSFYDIKDENNECKSVGFVADEVEPTFPELIPERDLETEIYRSVSYSRITAYIVSALKEIKERLEVLESKL